MDDINIRYVAIRYIDDIIRDDDDNHYSPATILDNDTVLWLDDAMYLQDDYFHGVISMSYSCGYYIKYLSNDIVAVAYVTC